MKTHNGIDSGFTPTGGWQLIQERRAAARARSAQGAAQFAAGHAAARRLYTVCVVLSQARDIGVVVNTNSTYFIFARKRLSL